MDRMSEQSQSVDHVDDVVVVSNADGMHHTNSFCGITLLRMHSQVVSNIEDLDIRIPRFRSPRELISQRQE